MVSVLSRPETSWLLYAAYVSFGTVAVFESWFLNDEGLLTWTFASMAWKEPAATIFLLKSRPMISGAYAAIAGLGVEPFLVTHVLVTGLAIPMTTYAAWREGQRSPLIAGAVVAFSPLMLSAGASGISNGDAAVLVALVVVLVSSSRSHFLWGLVTGSFVLARPELLVIGLPFAFLAVRAGEARRFLLGAFAIPVPYLLLGALYHGDVLWPLTYPPTLPTVAAENAYLASGHRGTLGGAIDAVLAVTAAAPLALLCRWRDLTESERAAASAAALYVATIRILPVLGIFNFDDSPRYLLPILPLLALVVGRLVSVWTVAGDRSAWTVAVLLGVLVAGVAVDDRPWAVVALAVFVSSIVTVVRLGWRRVAPLVMLGLAAGAWAWMPASRMRLADQGVSLDPIVTWLEEYAPSRPVVTNNRLLAQWVDREDTGEIGRVFYIMQPDQLAELARLSNDRNQQRERLVRLMTRLPYGEPVFPGALEAGDPVPNAVFVLMDDPRLAGVMDPDVWESRLRILHSGTGFQIAERVSNP